MNKWIDRFPDDTDTLDYIECPRCKERRVALFYMAEDELWFLCQNENCKYEQDTANLDMYIENGILKAIPNNEDHKW